MVCCYHCKNSNCSKFPATFTWRVQSECPRYRKHVNRQPDNSFSREEETHAYWRHNTPESHYCIGSTQPPMFNADDSIARKKQTEPWRFSFNEPDFVSRCLDSPPCVHLKEEECHEYVKKDSDYLAHCKPIKPCSPIPPSSERRLPMPKKAYISPLTISECVQYPNKMGEREWHAVKEIRDNQDDCVCLDTEVSQYERKVKTCDPCTLPHPCNDRVLSLPESQLKQEESCSCCCCEICATILEHKEDMGECNKRETRGARCCHCAGFVADAPLHDLNCIPHGYNFREQQSQCRSMVTLPATCLHTLDPCPPPVPILPPLESNCPCPMPKILYAPNNNQEPCHPKVTNQRQASGMDRSAPKWFYTFPIFAPPCPMLPPKPKPCPRPLPAPVPDTSFPGPQLPPGVPTCACPQRPPVAKFLCRSCCSCVNGPKATYPPTN